MRHQIIVVDDNSTDATAELVRGFEDKHPRIRLMPGGLLPGGWAGKPHACHIGAEGATAKWLCFMDADTVPGRQLLSSAVRVAEARGIDLLSLEPFQELGTCWERLILPVGFFLLAVTQDLNRVNNPSSPDAVANGQFILVRREVYEAIGGHAAVHDQIAEDSALARMAKRRGYRLAVLGAESLVRTRMYTDWPSLWEGLSKSVAQIVGSVRASVVVGIAAALLALIAVMLPIWTLAAAITEPTGMKIAAAILAWLAVLALVAVHIEESRHFRIPFWYGLLFPAGYILGAAVAINSALEHVRGQVRWKGRVYSPR